MLAVAAAVVVWHVGSKVSEVMRRNLLHEKIGAKLICKSCQQIACCRRFLTLGVCVTVLLNRM